MNAARKRAGRTSVAHRTCDQQFSSASWSSDTSCGEVAARHLHAEGVAARIPVAVGEVVGDDGGARRVRRDGAGEDVRQVDPRGAAAVKRQIGEEDREARACARARHGHTTLSSR
eukprot:6195236-Pleurochrysis_carterae.AAC.1